MALDRRFTSVFALAFALELMVVVLGTPAAAQTYSVLHYFTGGSDGGSPQAGVTVGSPGTLYGTTEYGGTTGGGVVFQLKERLSSWTLNPLYEFAEGTQDGYFPVAGVVIGPNGALYGTTPSGGTAGGYGNGV